MSPDNRPTARRRFGGRAVASGLAVAAALLAAGCASAPRYAFSPRDLRAQLAARLSVEEIGDLVVPYEVDAPLVARAKKYTEGIASDHARADRLARAMIDSTQFGLRWERVTTTVARETVANGYGNCLSLTSVYIGLARAIGLTAYYVDASDRINSLERDQQLLVRTGHIIATVRTERGWSMVDFTGELSHYRTFRVIDDREALAHFYNNRGYEMIATAQAAGEPVRWELALRDFRLAARIQPDFARAHNNLGVAYARLGRDEEARQAYLAAIAADPEFAEPRQNLGNLALRAGDPEQAIRWYRAALETQADNPYLHYHYGLAQYQAGDVDGAIRAFQRAIALKHDYREPRNLLAQAYRHQGRFEEAERVLRAIRQRRRPEG